MNRTSTFWSHFIMTNKIFWHVNIKSQGKTAPTVGLFTPTTVRRIRDIEDEIQVTSV